MLAPLDLQATAQALQDRVYSGFPFWHGLVVAPNREEKSAIWLRDNVGILVYLPTFTKQVRCQGHVTAHRARLYAALPGLLFVPEEFIHIPRRKEVFDYARVHGFMKGASGYPLRILKAEIELIRLLEAKLNLPPEAKGTFFKVGQEVRFHDGSLWQSWGGGTIVEIASESRIGVEVPYLFGRTTKVFVPASEIEAM